MADRYWVGGTASWDGTAGTKWALTSGGLGGQAVPTSADDVFFSNLSTGTCTIATGNTGAKSINCTGFTGTIAGSAAITVSGSITLVAGMTYTYSGAVTINGTGTLTTAGKTFGALTINGSGITVTLGDNLSVTGQILTVTLGTFNTAGFNITCAQLSSSNTNVRAINLGASTVTITAATALIFTTATNLTFNAGTSQIDFSVSNPLFNGGGQTFNNVSFTSTALITLSITGANTFNNLTFAARAASGIGVLNLGANQTINGTFTVQSGATDPTRRLLIASDTIGTARTINSAANTIFGADFRDITAAGVASWTDSSRTNYWGDCKGNTGITFNAGRTVYWNLAGAQNWSATGWTDTSTGTPNAQYFPLAQDTATFTDAGSVTGTITVNAAWHIGTMDMSGRTSAMTLATGGAAPFVYGNWTNGSGTTLSGSGTITFSGRTTQTITSASKTFTQPIIIDSLSGTVQLGDAFNGSNTFTHTTGTFNANNKNFTILTFDSSNSNTRTLTMGSGLWTITGTGTVWTTQTTSNLTFNKDTADILLSNTTTTSRIFIGGGLTYNKLTIGGTTGTSIFNILSTANTFSELASTKTVAHTISFAVSTTINTWSVTGSAGNVVTVNSTSAGTSRTLTITNRTSGIDYLDVQDITASLAPVTFYAGANTRLRSNVRGVAAVAPTANQFIYVLNSGTSFTTPANWNNSNNEIHLFAGGGGGGGANVGAVNAAASGGGGGGGYTKATNVTLSGSISYAIGAAGTAGSAAGSAGGAGGNTTFNSGAYTTTGGGGGSSTTTPTSVGGTAGTGSTYNGGVGGLGATTLLAATVSCGGGGGGGAGGTLGTGGTGGDGYANATAANVAGGGGGGNGGGTNGGNASSATGGTGGNNNAGVGGGASATSGFNGGGGGGQVGTATTFIASGSGVDIANAGMGSGAGAPAFGTATPNSRASLFGGGGCGGGTLTTTARAGFVGAQGGIVIVYSAGSTPVANSNFFFLFG